MRRFIVLLAILSGASTVLAADTPPMTPDISGKPFVAPDVGRDYDKRVVMVPMRDGTKLHTVIVVPKGARNAPILLTRTPYDAAGRASNDRNLVSYAHLFFFPSVFSHFAVASKFSIQLLEFVWFGLGGFQPFGHCRPAHNGVAISGADLIKFNVVS